MYLDYDTRLIVGLEHVARKLIDAYGAVLSHGETTRFDVDVNMHALVGGWRPHGEKIIDAAEDILLGDVGDGFSAAAKMQRVITRRAVARNKMPHCVGR